uniref:BTB domain-containing protein n=1 Tax=Heliothis virescens TaxID=7102 RepID=A0A2A4JFV1_HELVI
MKKSQRCEIYGAKPSSLKLMFSKDGTGENASFNKTENIVNVSSVFGDLEQVTGIYYCMSKAGHGLILPRIAATELALMVKRAYVGRVYNDVRIKGTRELASLDEKTSTNKTKSPRTNRANLIVSLKRCLMPGTELNNRPVPADQFSACNEESQLELHLQRQLEDDVARIRTKTEKRKGLASFCPDNDSELSLEFLTNLYTLILKCDVYTECNIQHEEKEIINYLQRNLNVIEPDKPNPTKEEGEESEVYSTPKCITPYVDNDVQKVIHSSPSTELTKEYYALVPIEGNLLEKELTEQDELSNAFQSIIKGQSDDTSQVKIFLLNKPTSLYLNSSHTSKTVKHSSSCDILNNVSLKDNTSPKQENNLHTVADKDFKTNRTLPSSDITELVTTKNLNNPNLSTDKPVDPPYSPDSLITDEPSSSSDYLSAAYTFSPGASSSGFQHQVNVESITSKMENIHTLSDSGLEDTAMLGSVNSHKDVTLTNISLSENTLQDLITDDASISTISIPSSLTGKNHLQRSKQSGTSFEKDCNGQNTHTDMCGKSIKEEKQRQNEEIVILESSSLSSETGSWESVYPPKLVEKEICEKFLNNERRQCFDSPNLVQKSPLKSTACFIDASSLVDEDETIELIKPDNVKLDILPTPSQPVPCSTVKQDISPVDWSESNDNEDSLEKKDPDSIQKDLSPTIFEMTPITEDSLSTNAFETAAQAETAAEERPLKVSAVFMSSTPNNSMLSFTNQNFKQYESEDSESNNTIVDSDSFAIKPRKGSRSPPILSGGVSVEDHLPQVDAWPRTSSASAWVVDMSAAPKTDDTSTKQQQSKTNSKSSDDAGEKKNMFSMYIDLGDRATLKDMPTRLASSKHTKKNSLGVDNKSTTRNSKTATGSTDISVSVFEKYESLCNDPSISISEIIAIPDKKASLPEVLDDSPAEVTTKVHQSRVNKTNDKMAPNKELPEPPTEGESKDLFVKLSDLDKPVQKSDVLLSIEAKSVDVRMTRSIPDWGEQGFSTNSRSIEVITSFHSENALSLNRLFPHLKNEFSRSMPGSLSSRTRSPLRLGTSSTLGDADEQGSDMSELSSMQSSNCRSGFGNSTTDSQTSSLIENCTSRLGQDLLRMFLDEIAPDVIVEVSGKRFKAHKCILSSRCQYFAGILSGGWVESLGNVIVLPPFSYNVVYFALCHIYSGLATIPDSVSILELATIADMLSLEGLKEAIMFTLKAKYCHHFHKPCAVCIVGVLECFPLCAVYGLDDLYHKCIKWITKYFTKVWPTKAFATLPTDLLDKCLQHHIVNLSLDNVVETVYGCGITAASLQNSRWAESVARLCRRLISAAAHFACNKLTAVFQAIPPLPSDSPHAAKQALEDFLASAIEWAGAEELCRAYGFLSTVVKEIRNSHYSKPDLISNGTDSRKNFGPNNPLYMYAGSWRMQCEGALVRAAPRVVTTQAFKNLPSELRKRLRELGCIKYGAHAMPLSSPTHHQEKNVKPIPAVPKKKPAPPKARMIDMAHVRALFVPYSPKPVIPGGSVDTLKSNNDLRDVKKPTHPPKVRTTKAQEERAKFNKSKTTTSQDRLNTKSSGVRPPSFDKTKARYLESKNNKERKVVNKHLPRIDSSSESSRNSSPVAARRARAARLGAMSQDSLASRPRTAEPSTDSLTESLTSNKHVTSNKYATYTKARRCKGSSESIKQKTEKNGAAPVVSKTQVKTKIPVYLNQRDLRDQQKKGRQVPGPSTNSVKSRSNDRKVPGSLMNATKSSSAKMVPKVVKEPAKTNNMTKSARSGQTSKQQEEKAGPAPRELGSIPAMERSGTFLKDEPTFGDKLTNLDISQ